MARVITEVGSGRYQFAHALVRDTIYSGLTATRRARLHHRVGDALAALPGDPKPRLPALAHHFAAAASDGAAAKAGDSALAAARQAFDQAAWDDAVAFVDRGLSVLSSDDPEHLERRFELLVMSFDARGVALRNVSHAVVLQAVEAARLWRSPEGLARVASFYLFGRPSDPRAAEFAQEALLLLGDSNAALRARLLAALSLSFGLRRSGLAEAQADAAVALARESGDRDAIHAGLYAKAQLLAGTPRARERLAVETELLELGPTDSPVADVGRWKNSVGRGRAIALLILGDRNGFEAQVEAIEQWYQRIRNPGLAAQVAMWRILLALLDGRFGEVPAAADALRRMTPVEANDVTAEATMHLSRLALERGRAAEAKAEQARLCSLMPGYSVLASILALLHVETGEPEEALRIIDGLAPNRYERVRFGLTTINLAYIAEAVTSLGDVERATTVYEVFAPFTGLVVAGGLAGHTPGSVDRHLGQLATVLHRWDDAERHFDAALVMDAGLRAPPLLARTRYGYGRMLVERDQPGDATRARDLLGPAAETADDLGMVRLATQASELL